MSKEERDSWWLRDIGIILGFVRSRVEKNTYKFTGAANDPEWERFKSDRAKDEADGFHDY